MAPSLRDRLLGRNANGAASAPPTGETDSPTTLSPMDSQGRPQTPTGSASVPGAGDAARIDPRAVRAAESRISAVDQLKLELHRKLIERLDLAALERVTDETLLVAQIRSAVIEFIRAEQAPL
ncbi:MAG: hypothetical protein JWL95_935, partial [Gemmatimonadetes bacterium]|nr:hypothetical protein [Gemmatimonadota bacterium]